MTALQWMINIVLLGCLTYTVYDTPYQAYNFRYALKGKSNPIFCADSNINNLFWGIHTGDYGSDVVVLLTEVVASSTMIGTIVTGMLGLTACCKGFGRLLAYQEALLQNVSFGANFISAKQKMCKRTNVNFSVASRWNKLEKFFRSTNEKNLIKRNNYEKIFLLDHPTIFWFTYFSWIISNENRCHPSHLLYFSYVFILL